MTSVSVKRIDHENPRKQGGLHVYSISINPECRNTTHKHMPNRPADPTIPCSVTQPLSQTKPTKRRPIQP
jgi:hypothetical protein